MKIPTRKLTFLAIFLLALNSKKIYAQESNVTVNQDPKLEQLLAEKRKINSSLTITDRYKIQIYSGESEAAKKTLGDFRKEFKNYDGTIVFNTPVYKVWIGNFKTRIEAERNLSILKKKYPNALLIRPNK
jgi:hypothetical protein